MSFTPIPLKDRPPESWAGVAAGLVIYLVADLMLFMAEVPYTVQPAAWLVTFRSLTFWGMLVVPALGLMIGWIRGFPAWSYPYGPLAIFFALYIANASTPGMTINGYPTFGRQLWGPRAFIPLLLAILTAWLVTRSFKPVRKFFTQIGEDWTLGSYGLSSTLTLVIFIAYDEMDRLYTLRGLLILAAMMTLMVLFYLRCRTSRARRLTVLIGIPLILGFTAISTTLFWWSQGPDNVYLPGMIAWTVVLLVFYLYPGMAVELSKRALAQASET